MADYQLDAIWSPARYSVIEASTKSGKTAGCIVWLFEQAMMGPPHSNHWWVAPVYRQALIAFRRMKRGLPKAIYSSHEGENRITLSNNAHIWFLSAEKPDNLYGEDVFSAVMDEASRAREEAWYAVRSTLTATRGPVRIIGNVKGKGTWAYKLGREAEKLGMSANMHYARINAYDAVDAGVLDAEEIEDAKARLPEHKFKELYLAEPADLEGLIYKNFSIHNISSDIKDIGGEIHVGMDFNVDPMSACLSSKVGDQLHTWDEIVIHNGDTETTCQEIKDRYPDRKIIVYPDPAGRHRHTSAKGGDTDFSIIKSFGFEIVAPHKAPPVSDRINEVNALCLNTNGERRFFVNPCCEQVIECLETQQYKDDTSQPDKKGGFDHMNDALGYKIHSLFPIVSKASVKVKRLRG